MEVFFATEPTSALNQQLVVDYESIVWTDRWRTHGDFVMTLKETEFLKQDLRNLYFLLSSESRHVMFIESVETIGDGKLKVSGNSLERILDFRGFAYDNTTGNKRRAITGRPGAIIHEILSRELAGDSTGSTSTPNGLLPNLVMGSFTTKGSSRTDYVVRGDPYSKLIKGYCDEYDFGYEMVRNAAGDRIVFNTFVGTDRSNRDSSNYVLFSRDLGGLTGHTSLRSIQGWINRIQTNIIGPQPDDDGSLREITTTWHTSKSASGFAMSGWRLRTLMIRDEDNPNPTSGRSIAQEEFAKFENQYQNLVEGEVNPEYFAQQNLKLGDTVELMGYFNERSKYFIEEIVHTDDKLGYRKYPTFKAVD